MKGWISLFSKTKLTWQTQVGIKSPTFSATRWWSRWEVMRHIYDYYGDVPSCMTMKNFHHQRSFKIFYQKSQIELAITVDAMKVFVEATYNLEGDGPLIFYCIQKDGGHSCSNALS